LLSIERRGHRGTKVPLKNPHSDADVVWYINTTNKYMIDSIKTQAEDKDIEIIFTEISGLEAMLNMCLFEFIGAFIRNNIREGC